MIKRSFTSLFNIIILIGVILPVSVLAQGSIYGVVSNSDFTAPADGELSFFGYLDDSDEEIKIETCVGAGYESPYWFDDFQNYLTEAAGNPYDFHFYNSANNEGFILSNPIPGNSLQQEDINLSPVSWPSKPVGFDGIAVAGPAIELTWDAVAGNTYHIYRREATSGGSFFRIDDVSGSLDNPGVSGGSFIDYDVDGITDYHYLIIAEDESRNLGLHSNYISVPSVQFMCADANSDGTVNILDIVFIINYKYKDGPEPVYLESCEVNGDGKINILDVVYILNYKYKEGPPPECPEPTL